jgi:Asp-tRNA(Asn)/Glu-tRNA(Gln) amidotransferase A subunit family amidase
MSDLNPPKDPWKLTAVEALPLLRNGDLKAIDYAKSLLHRIQQRDQDVKAWVFLNPSQILQNAQRLDELPASQRGPLHGLPVGVKDIILTKDMPTQYNSKLFESETPIGVDASCVATLRGSGALVFGKVTTTEFATTKQGNWHQNLTRNALDPKRTPGGSSSGSGAAVGDFQVPVALGTQTGGSIIRPASFNGCYGLK